MWSRLGWKDSYLVPASKYNHNGNADACKSMDAQQTVIEI